MTIASVKYFDTHEFIKKSKELGASEELAEYQVKQIEQAIEVAVTTIKEDLNKQDLATRKDIEIAKNQIILWVAGLFIASGLIQHFFK